MKHLAGQLATGSGDTLMDNTGCADNCSLNEAWACKRNHKNKHLRHFLVPRLSNRPSHHLPISFTAVPAIRAASPRASLLPTFPLLGRFGRRLTEGLKGGWALSVIPQHFLLPLDFLFGAGWSSLASPPPPLLLLLGLLEA